jgi:hypothetical protein
MADSLTNGPARDRFWSRACRARHPVRPGVSEPSQVRILLRSPVMPRPPRDSSATSMVSDSGSETGAASSAHMRPAAVSLTVYSALTSTYIPHQVRYSNVCVVRDEEASGSNPVTPASSAGVGCCCRSPRIRRWPTDGQPRYAAGHRAREEALGTAGPVQAKLQPRINACAKRLSISSARNPL